MATTLPATISSSFLQPRYLTVHSHNQRLSLFLNQKRFPFKIQAAKLPTGVELPKVEPKFQAPFWGFTSTAEMWNSRACMIGLIGVFIVELIINKGILQVIGVDVGKGLDLPL
ncbi:hypothetical protein NMG60_11000341 [Bertholletia excelsa]